MIKRTIRSFVCRNRKMTSEQAKAWELGYQQYGLTVEQIVDRAAVLEIGFGDGANLLNIAQNYPKQFFVGIEVYLAGFRKLFKRLIDCPLNNLGVVKADACDVLVQLPANSLAGCLILFPDPWPKKRNHKRRLINEAFVNLLVNKMKVGGQLLIKTDDLNYGEQIQAILAKVDDLQAGEILWQTVQTNFERKGLAKQHPILSFSRIKK